MDRGDDLESLIERAQGGDVRAFEALIAAHLPQIRRFARAFAPREADADDLAQEALLKVYRNLQQYRYQAAFSTWLYAVVRNVFLDAHRSRGGRERALEDELQPRHVQDLDGPSRADALLEQAEERERVWAALRRVPLEYRTALVLFDIEGHPYDAIAAVEGVAVGTVKSRLFRGRAQLRKLLQEPEGAEAGARPAAAGEGAETSGAPPSSNVRSRG